MGKNRKNQFNGLPRMDGSEEETDEDILNESEDELQTKIKEYHNFLNEEQVKLKKEIQNNPTLTKNIIKIFLSILDHSYDLIGEISTLLEENNDKSSDHIYVLDQKLNPVYKMMDKYRDVICSEDGWRRMNRLDFLNEVDIYYNMFVCSQSLKYISFALKNSPQDMLNIVDVMFYKDGRENRRTRYETYMIAMGLSKS